MSSATNPRAPRPDASKRSMRPMMSRWLVGVTSAGAALKTTSIRNSLLLTRVGPLDGSHRCRDQLAEALECLCRLFQHRVDHLRAGAGLEQGDALAHEVRGQPLGAGIAVGSRGVDATECLPGNDAHERHRQWARALARLP